MGWGQKRISSTTLKDVRSLYPCWERAKPGERLAPTQGEHPSPRIFAGGASKTAHTCRKGGPAKASAEEKSTEWTPGFWTVCSEKTRGASVSPGIPDPQPSLWPSHPRGLSIQEGGPGRWVDRATGEVYEDHLKTLSSQAGPNAAELHSPSFTQTRQIL